MTSSSSSLIDDISDELLVCRVCCGPLRCPKTLTCRHTFCQVCLERLRDELSTGDDDVRRRTPSLSRRTHSAAAAAAAAASRLTCPVCYETCPLPPGGVRRLPDDPVVTQLYEVIERRKSTTQSDDDGRSERLCEICSKASTGANVRPRHRPAHVKCVECGKLLCSSCARLHRRTNVTSGHSLIDVDSVELSTECQHHSGELVRFYCDTCDVCVCVLCTYRGQPHSDDHNVLSFNDAVAVHRAPLTALLTECRQRLHDVRARYDLVVTHDQLIRKVEDSIHEVAMETVSHIRRRERQLVAALQTICGDDVDDERRIDRKKALSEHVRGLEGACDAADKLLKAVSEGSGPAEFLLQRRRTVDAMTSLMTSQTKSFTDWPKYERQVRFEPYGLDSALGMRVGRLVVADVEGRSQHSERSTQQHTQTYSAATVADADGVGEWIEVKLSDASVQTDELDQSLVPSSRCEASGSVSAATTRLSVSHGQHVTSGVSPTTARRRPASPASSASASSQAAAAPAAGTLSEHVTSLCDASTLTTTVDVVSSSTVTDRLQTRHQSTHTGDLSAVICHDQQTSTEPLADVQHRATSFDEPLTCSLGVTAAPVTADKSTSTIHSTDVHTSSDAQLQLSHDAHDEDLTQLTSLSTCSAPTASDTALQTQTPHSYSTRSGDSVILVESVPSVQPTSASAVDVPDLSSAGSADFTAGLGRLTSDTSELKTENRDASTAAAPSVRLAALLPEIARTADVLAASHFSTGLTARLLREIVDVGLQMTSSCRRHTTDAATDTTDRLTNNGSSAAPPCCDMKWTQTEAVCSDVVDKGVGQSVVTTSDVSTLVQLTPMTFDKETSTARAHQVNKNVATDSLSTVDKQTWMPIDVGSAYLASTAVATRRVVSVSRGTSTPACFAAPSQPLVDRATSPVRVTLVDKSVTASKAEALELVDTFQAAGQLSGPLSPRARRQLSLSPRSKLACISETAERYDEEQTEELDDARSTVDTSDLLDNSQTRSPQRGPASTSTHLPTTCMSRPLQQPQVGQLSRSIFNFDHVVKSRFAALSQHPVSLDDDLMSSSVARDVAKPSESASSSVGDMCMTAVVQRSTDDVHLADSQPPVDI